MSTTKSDMQNKDTQNNHHSSNVKFSSI